MADVIPLKRLSRDTLTRYDAVVFHRPPYEEALIDALELLQRQRIPHIADYDDLIFDRQNAGTSSVVRNGRLTLTRAEQAFDDNLQALKLFEHVSVSTDPLADEVRRSHPKARVQVIHNGLSLPWIESITSRGIFSQPHQNVTIGYFSGTQSHDYDFLELQPTLIKSLSQHANTSLMIVGQLNFDAAPFSGLKVSKLPIVPYEELPKFIARAHINVAPLENSVFNRCKSGLKFFEAAVVGTATVATPIADMKRFKDGPIRLASSPNEWRAHLDELSERVRDTTYREELRTYALDACRSSTQTERFVSWLGGMA